MQPADPSLLNMPGSLAGAEQRYTAGVTIPRPYFGQELFDASISCIRTGKDEIERRLGLGTSPDSPVQQFAVKITKQVAARQETLDKLDSFLSRVQARKISTLPSSELGYLVEMSRAQKERLAGLCPRTLGVVITPQPDSAIGRT
ncbi:unnamed protein product [Peniophora sp. CBMAI 1063]|nr:unnamed protein product [Peniophora sp. CBMAI 1063]